VGVGKVAGRLPKLGEQKRRTQFEAAGGLPPRNGDGGLERLLGDRQVGSPPVRWLTRSTTSLLSARRAVSSPTICATSARSRGLSEMTLWWERRLQGARNSGRAVAMMKSGAVRPRSTSACIKSSEVGSAQCRSSTARTTGCERAPARTYAISAASCLEPANFGPGSLNRLGALVGADVDALGANEDYVGDAEEAEHTAQVCLLLVEKCERRLRAGEAAAR
jgi:hypothetical protein